MFLLLQQPDVGDYLAFEALQDCFTVEEGGVRFLRTFGSHWPNGTVISQKTETSERLFKLNNGKQVSQPIYYNPNTNNTQTIEIVLYTVYRPTRFDPSRGYPHGGKQMVLKLVLIFPLQLLLLLLLVLILHYIRYIQLVHW